MESSVLTWMHFRIVGELQVHSLTVQLVTGGEWLAFPQSPGHLKLRRSLSPPHTPPPRVGIQGIYHDPILALSCQSVEW